MKLVDRDTQTGENNGLKIDSPEKIKLINKDDPDNTLSEKKPQNSPSKE